MNISLFAFDLDIASRNLSVAMTEEQVQSAKAHGYSAVMLGFDVLMLKNTASTAIGWARSSA